MDTNTETWSKSRFVVEITPKIKQNKIILDCRGGELRSTSASLTIKNSDNVYTVNFRK